MNLLIDSCHPRLTVVPQSFGHTFVRNLDPSVADPMVSGDLGGCFGTSLSPNLSFLDHQETVETHESHQISHDLIDPNETESESNFLFSFEVDTNGLPQSLIDQTDETSIDFDWSDILGSSSDPVDLNDINITPFSSPRLTNFLESQTKLDLGGKDETITASKSNSRKPLLSSNFVLEEPNHSEPSYELDLTAHARTRKFNWACKVKLEDDEFDLPSRHIKSAAERCLNNEDLINGRPGERLNLSSEEQKMLHSMDIRLPTRFPLSRGEEKALRTVRRKIRNKLSAQASRIRRQEYMVELEHRMERSNKENDRLRHHIGILENDKRDLLSHIQRLRSYISKFLNRQDQPTPLPLFVKSRSSLKSASQTATAAAGGTSLLIVVFMVLAWTALVPFPSIRFSPLGSLSLAGESKSTFGFFPGRSRTLLESKETENVVLEENATQDDQRPFPPSPVHRTHGARKPGVPPLEDYGKSAVATGNRSVDRPTTKFGATDSGLADATDIGAPQTSAVLNLVATMDL